VELHLHSPNTSSWCGTSLNTETALLLPYSLNIEWTMFKGNVITMVLGLSNNVLSSEDDVYEGVSKSFRTGRLLRELQMVQLSATMPRCIAILWLSLVSFAAITLCVASHRVFIFLIVYFTMTQSGNFWIHPRIVSREIQMWWMVWKEGVVTCSKVLTRLSQVETKIQEGSLSG
jgi:hypothetical protein